LKEFDKHSYDVDTTASAVILLNTCDITFETNSSPYVTVLYKIHRKIHLLRRDAFDHANVAINYYSYGNYQPITDLEAQTVNVDVDGRLSITKVDKKSIYEEDVVDRFKVLKFAFPAVQEGSIIEYQYTLRLGLSRVLPSWRAQEDLPILDGRLKIQIPTTITMVPYIENLPDNLLKKEDGFFYAGTETKYTLKNMPAMKKEAFSGDMEDFLARIKFVVTGVSMPGYYPKYFSETWFDVADKFLSNDHFPHGIIAPSEPIKFAKKLLVDIPDPLERMKRIYYFVTSSMKWNKQYSRYPNVLPIAAYNSHSANSAAINVLLHEMLLASNIKADLLFVSTKDNGKAQTIYPDIWQFNHLMVVAEADSQKYFLDAVNPMRPFGMVGTNDIGGPALRVGNGRSAWERPEPRSTSKKVVITSVQLDSVAVLSGKVNIGVTDYDAVAMRDYMENKTVKELLAKELSKPEELDWIDPRIENLDSIEKSLKIDFSFNSGLQEQKAPAKIVYLKPFPFNFGSEDPFKEKERSYPVNFGHPFEVSYKTSLFLSPGYKVSELPKSIKLTLPDEGATYSFLIHHDGNLVQISSTFKINRIEFATTEYKDLKELYDRMSEILNSTIVIEKE